MDVLAQFSGWLRLIRLRDRYAEDRDERVCIRVEERERGARLVEGWFENGILKHWESVSKEFMVEAIAALADRIRSGDDPVL